MDTELKTDTPAVVVERPETDGDVPSVASAGAMIVFDAVRKIYEPNVAALTDVSFVIDKGEFVFVVGATSAASFRTSSCSRTGPRPRTSPTP
jgi:ABC-type multidrug transport system fused ATPase/permease subunit